MNLLELDKGSTEIYLSMLLKDNSLFKMAVEYITPEVFTQVFPEHEEFYLFWFVLAPVIKKYKLKLTADLVRKGSHARLSALYENEEDRKAKVKLLTNFFIKVDTLNSGADKQWVLDYTKLLMQTGSVLPKMASLTAQAEIGDIEISDAVKQLSDLSRHLGPTQRPVVDPFDLLTLPPQEEDADLVKTYIDWFDIATGGGLYKEEPHTLIMPTGEGKTTVTGQIAAFRARHKQKTLVVITEGGVNRKMTSKIQGALLQLPCKSFDKDDTSPLFKPELLNETHKNFLQNASGAVRLIDLVDHGEGVGWLDFIREYDRCVSEGFQPGLIVIDWAGLLAKSLVDNAVYKDQHMALEHIAIQCTNFCKEFKVPILITQQVTAAIAETKGTRPTYTVQDVDGCKKWANHFCTAAISTKFDDKGFGTMFFEKTRYSEGNQRIILQRKGNIGTFVKAPDSVKFSGSRYVDSDETFGSSV